MEDSIGVRSSTKAALAESKPPMMSWDAYLGILRSSVDDKALRRNMEKILDHLERQSYDRAIARVRALRAGKVRGYPLGEAKERMRRHRLARHLEEVSRLLRAKTLDASVENAVKVLDQELHGLLPSA